MTLVKIINLNSTFLTMKVVSNELVMNYLIEKLDKYYEFEIHDDVIWYSSRLRGQWEFVHYSYQEIEIY